MIISDLKIGDSVCCLPLSGKTETVSYGIVFKLEDYLSESGDCFRKISIKINRVDEFDCTIKNPIDHIDAFLCGSYLVSTSKSELLNYLSKLIQGIAGETDCPQKVESVEVKQVPSVKSKKHTNSKSDDVRKLRTMGASWFVSYAYYNLCDANHMNWNKATTIKPRLSSYNNGQQYMETWVNMVLDMNDNNLGKNHIGLNAGDIKRMAEKILIVLKKKRK